MRIVLIATLALLAAACGGGADDQAGNAAADANEAAPKLDETQRRVTGLSEGERNAVLIRAIRDARQPCQHVESSIDAGTGGKVPVYFATCEDGAVYAVAIGAGGNASVRAVTPAEAKAK